MDFRIPFSKGVSKTKGSNRRRIVPTRRRVSVSLSSNNSHHSVKETDLLRRYVRQNGIMRPEEAEAPSVSHVAVRNEWRVPEDM